MVDAFLCLVLDVFGLASIESAVPSLPWVSSFQGRGTMPWRSRFTLLSRFCPPRRTCYSSPNICSLQPELYDMVCSNYAGTATSSAWPARQSVKVAVTRHCALKLTIPPRGGRGAPCAPPLTRGYFHQGANSKNGVAERFVAADCLEVSHDFSRRLPIYVAEDHPKHAPHGLVALSVLLKHFH